MINFSDIDLIEPLQKTLKEKGYSTPTPIQANAIPAAIEGHDVLGIAQTGTGKTAAFALPILNRLGSQNCKSQPGRPLALILAPTRELAIQIGTSLQAYGTNLRLRTCTIFGGVGQGKQVNQLRRGAHILVATPGRLLDLIDQGFIHLDQLEVLVLDEADRMLDMGFLPPLKRIIRLLPEDRQSLFFSATLPPSIGALAKQLLSNPVNVNIAPKSVDVKKIDQRFVLVEKGEKQGMLRTMLSGTDVDRAIVFTKTKRGANRLSEGLQKSGLRAVAIHGNKSQAARQKALAAFRSNQAKVLVATDVAARGIDIPGVSHVVNFDMPVDPESYVHRIGRTGRAGAEGIAISFCLQDERRELRAIERLLGKTLSVSKSPAVIESSEKNLGIPNVVGHDSDRLRIERSHLARARRENGTEMANQQRKMLPHNLNNRPISRVDQNQLAARKHARPTEKKLPGMARKPKLRAGAASPNPRKRRGFANRWVLKQVWELSRDRALTPYRHADLAVVGPHATGSLRR